MHLGGVERHGISLESNKREFLGLLCNLYIVALLAVLPLYTKRTYYLIGDDKYQFFYNVSIICLGLWQAMEILTILSEFLRKEFGRKKNEQGLGRKPERRLGEGEFLKKLSPVDICMFFYGACVLLSAFHSAYEKTPWVGYQDWHMGAISQVLFIGIYFFVSRNYNGSSYPLYLGEAALFFVVSLGLAQRLGWDLLGLMAPFSERDWEYSHMLSTVGNINWLCGYLAVTIAFPLSGYLNGKSLLKDSSGQRHRPVSNVKRYKQVLLFFTTSLSLALFILQGSDIGIILVIAGIGICLIAGYFPFYRHHARCFFERGILLAAVVLFEISVMSWLVGIRKTLAAMPSDSPLQAALNHPVRWLAATLIFGALYLLLRRMPNKAHRAARITILLLGIVTVATCGTWYLSRQPAGDVWGSGRGGLWAAAWKGFTEAGWLQKLIGAGPDCFAEYLYRLLPTSAIDSAEGRWQKAVFANAHNEWLSQLVNLGILGTAAYAGIFISAFKRYRGMLLGIFAIVLYGIASLTGFQQVLNTPLFFLVLGLCENRYRLSQAGSASSEI